MTRQDARSRIVSSLAPAAVNKSCVTRNPLTGPQYLRDDERQSLPLDIL
jgi:hypothetical protein